MKNSRNPWENSAVLKRRDAIKLAGAAIAAVPAGAIAASSVRASADDCFTVKTHNLFLKNDSYELEFVAGKGVHCKITHRASGTVLADAAYSYSCGTPIFTEVKQNGGTVVLLGRTDTGLSIEHSFIVDADASWIEEKLKITNMMSHPVVLPLRCGFVLPVKPETLRGYVFTDVPYVRQPMSAGGAPEEFDRVPVSEYRKYREKNVKRRSEYSLEQVLYTPRRAHPDRILENPALQVPFVAAPRLFAENYSSEGWAISDGRQGFLVTKYSQLAREYAVLDRVSLSEGLVGLRWGGVGVQDDSEEGYFRLMPGSSREFGLTRLSAFQGDAINGYYAFRSEMESRGHGVPANYDPPVHWNELYDNKLWWLEGGLAGQAYVKPENREKYYSLKDMREAAAQACAMNCEALYLDPGWDMPQSSKVWDEKRLGKLSDFLTMLKQEYAGLRLALHTPLSGWTGLGTDVIEGAALVNALGEPTLFACGASQQFVEGTARRLATLARAGVCFFMFDGTPFQGECWDTNHGHSVPSTRDEHVDATNRLCRRVHQMNPNVLIEMHDQALGGGDGWPLVPIYLGHGQGADGQMGFDERWGFEFMWNPIEDLLRGHSLTLYYYNLAYILPLYIHIDLRTDNRNALVFWWNASTCRHMGIGGTHKDPAVVEIHKQAMKTYRRLKPYFARGVFYGIDEMTHVHSDRNCKSAVMNCFNLEDHEVEREIRFEPAQLGLMSDKTYRFKYAAFKRAGSAYVGEVKIAAYGHTLIEVV